MYRVQKPSSHDKSRQLPSQESASRKQISARSCLGCHRRKVRCDRGVPCTNCSKCGFTCEYPTKDSDGKAPTLQRISARLERLESMISNLAQGQVSEPISEEPEPQVGRAANKSPSDQNSQGSWELLLNDGQGVHYVNNSNIKDLLPDEERIQVSQTANNEAGVLAAKETPIHHTPLQQPSPLPDTVSDVLEFYPEPQLALQLWSVYVKTVDPVLKILHIPTAQSSVISTILDPKSAGRSMISLTYAIYFAAVTSLEQNNESVNLPMESTKLLKMYRSSLDRLLIVTDIMNRPELTALQALSIYVTCLRVHETGRSIWVLVGLAIRLAQSIGLHRDGASLRLSPFETEMRLRLWWHLCTLDSRAPEDHGFEPTMNMSNGSLRLPLNVNDDQIYPSMTQLPAECEGWTEMSFFLVLAEACMLLQPVLGSQVLRSADASVEMSSKKKLMKERARYFANKFKMALFNAVDPRNTSELARLASQHCTTAHYKMDFILQLRNEMSRKQRNDSRPDSQDWPRLSFKIACDVLKSYYALTKGHLASKFKWLFATYTQWYALAYVLRCLCNHPDTPDAENIWAVVEEVFPHDLKTNDQSPDTNDGNRHSSIWRCLILLRKQALLLKESRASAARGPRAGKQHTEEHSPSQVANTISHPADNNSQPSHIVEQENSTQSFNSALGDELFMSEPNQNIFSLDLVMPEIPFLPDWNAVFNGSLDYDSDKGTIRQTDLEMF